MEQLEISTKEILQQQLDRLKKNRESIPVEEQRSKYRKAFEKLEQDIMASVYQLMKETVFYYWCSDAEKVAARNYFLELYKKSDVNTALRKYHADGVEAELERIKDTLYSFLMQNMGTTEYTKIRYSLDPFNPQKMIPQEDGTLVIVPDVPEVA